ncbi:acyl-protein thioesterase 1 [Amanita rubescens]|nr:acyl-protein thioesterase 1 [Amanita rubescens]
MSESKPQLSFITVGPFYHRHTATVIWLHGLGDTAQGMRVAANKLSLHPLLGHVKIILPTAFDCLSFDIENRREDEEGLLEGAERKAGIPPDRIIVGGLSQGGALAVLTGLTTTESPIAGVFLLSSYVPLRRKVREIATKLAAHVPLFWAHGKSDLQVRHDFALASAKQLASDLGVRFQLKERTQTRDDLERNGVDGLRFHTYPLLGHWITPDELDDLVVWVAYLLPDTKK